MDFEQPDNELEKAPYDEESFEESVPDDNIDEFGNEDIYSEKKANKRSLEIRRTIEAYLDEKKVKELHDYLSIDEYPDDTETGKSTDK